MRSIVIALLLVLGLTGTAWAGDVQGSVTDRSGGVLQGASVRLLNVATDQQTAVTTDASGHFRFSDVKPGVYRLSVVHTGFSDSSRTIIVTSDAQSLSADFELELGSVKEDVTISAARGERDIEATPLRADALNSDAIREKTPISTGDALAEAPGVTVVGSGPFQVRPRLRG